MKRSRLRPALAGAARISLAAVSILAAHGGEVTVHVGISRELPDLPEEASALAAARGATLRNPASQWEARVFAAGQTTLHSVTSASPGTFEGISTAAAQSGDNLVARWRASDSEPVRQTWLLDTSDENWFIFECDPAHFASATSFEAFLKSLLAWPYRDNVRLEAAYSLGAGETALRGSALLARGYGGGEYQVSVLRTGTTSYLLLKIGKGVFMNDYPLGGAYVRERFPPLSELVRDWSKERILSEIGASWQSPGTGAANNLRDEILINEVARRGLSSNDVERLLMPRDHPNTTLWELNTTTVLRALDATGQAEANVAAIANAALQIGRTPKSGRSTLYIFGFLDRNVKTDISATAIDCVRLCLDPVPPIDYLRYRGATDAAYKAVQGASVPPRSVGTRQAALDAIRKRIDSVQTKN